MIDRPGSATSVQERAAALDPAEILSSPRANARPRRLALSASCPASRVPRPETVLLYVSAFPEEIRNRPFLTMAYESGKRVILPRVDRRERGCGFHRIARPGRDLGPGTLGIPEPRDHCPEIGRLRSTGRSSRAWRSTARGLAWAGAPAITTAPARAAARRRLLGPRLDCQLVDELPVEPHDVRAGRDHHPRPDLHATDRRLRVSVERDLDRRVPRHTP